MIKVGQIERLTQNRIVKLFTRELGYTYLGNWEDRPNSSNIEEALLITYLSKKGYNPTLITKALHELRVTANNYTGNGGNCEWFCKEKNSILSSGQPHAMNVVRHDRPHQSGEDRRTRHTP